MESGGAERVARRFVVRGRVQGVGFRAFVRRRAEALGLRGEVWNRADGAVEAFAVGEPAALDALRSALREGPPAGRVEAVEEREAPMPADDGRRSGRFEIVSRA